MERIYVSQIIRAEADAVWAVVRDFNGLPNWHPAIADSTIENDRAADSVGCVRSFHLTDGGHIREQLTGLSDPSRRMNYIILESPMPVSGYTARIEVLPVTEDHASFVVWTAEFEVTGGEPSQTVDMVADGVFRAGLAALEEKLGWLADNGGIPNAMLVLLGHGSSRLHRWKYVLSRGRGNQHESPNLSTCCTCEAKVG